MLNEHDLRQRGIRLTPQRRMILDAIARSSGHITADDIHQSVRAVYPEMNISTVYRNLERLMALHLIAVTDLGGGHLCFEVLQKARHHHLICHKCGQMVEMSDDMLAGLRQSIENSYSFAVDIDHLALWGLCHACRAAHPTN
jgi:Fur family ferric uptake transcriptional regulator